MLRMKNFNILGVHWRIWLLGRGGGLKNQYRGGDCLKKGGGAWTVCQFIGRLGKKEGDGVFEVDWYPNTHNGGRSSPDNFLEKLVAKLLCGTKNKSAYQNLKVYLEGNLGMFRTVINQEV